MTTTDLFPNYMSGRLTLSAANTATVQTQELPVNRLRVLGDEATVIEMLWIDLDVRITDFIANTDDVTFSVKVGGLPTVVGTFDNPDVIATFGLENHLLTSGATILNQVRRYSWQSKDGRGLLIAADRIHLAGDSTGQGAAVQFNWRIFYRFVNVPIGEFVGIVQSQS